MSKKRQLVNQKEIEESVVTQMLQKKLKLVSADHQSCVELCFLHIIGWKHGYYLARSTKDSRKEKRNLVKAGAGPGLSAPLMSTKKLRLF